MLTSGGSAKKIEEKWSIIRHSIDYLFMPYPSCLRHFFSSFLLTFVHTVQKRYFWSQKNIFGQKIQIDNGNDKNLTVNEDYFLRIESFRKKKKRFVPVCYT